MPSTELPLLVFWEKTLGEVLDRTQKFPKAARFTFSSRIDNLALDILDGIVTARYAPSGQKATNLREIDVSLSRLRVLLRVAHDRGFVSTGGLEHLARQLDEAGRMVGGWGKQQREAAS